MLFYVLGVYGCELSPRQWYSNDSGILKKQLNQWFSSVNYKKLLQHSTGAFWFIVPHEGYGHSGQYAAIGDAYFLPVRSINKVIVLSPLCNLLKEFNYLICRV